MKKRFRGNSAFTLAEILITITIIAIIAVIAIPRFYQKKEHAVVSEAILMLATIRQGELIYKQLNGNYVAIIDNNDPNWGVIELTSPGTGSNIAFDYSVDSVSGKAIATRNTNRAGTLFVNQTIELYLENGTWSGTHPDKPANT